MLSGDAATVADMSTHVCVWFEDTWPDHVCACGARAVLITGDDGEPTFAVLDEVRAEVPHQRLPLSA